MIKAVEYISHFCEKEPIKKILNEGFKPSYANEKFQDFNALIPMISFSNILLRDVGKDEVLSYGDYAIAFTREWGISKGLNPVIYTHESGVLKESHNVIFEHTFFLQYLREHGEIFEELSKEQKKISEKYSFSNLTEESIKMLDYLSCNYNEELFNAICNHAKAIFEENLKIVSLMKNFKVSNKAGQMFVAYNDREWRKTYTSLEFILQGVDDENIDYKKWCKEKKPHFNEEEYRLTFDIEDVKAILVKEECEIVEMQEYLTEIYGKIIGQDKLCIGTKEQLMAKGF